jgi:hypothetical protein
MIRHALRTDGGGDDVPALLDALASTLRETEELPVAPSASVWLGEAHAVAADLAAADVDRDVVHERVGHVHRLLTNAGDVGNETAAARVAEATQLAEAVLDATDSPTGDDS